MQMKRDGRIMQGGIGAVGAVDEPQWYQEDFWDDISGKKLNPELIHIARAEELEEFRKHNVYVKVPIEECIKVTNKRPIGVRWVDVNKGDEDNPEYRSRLVAKEIKRDKRDDNFAATPPLEAKKILFSLAVTEGVGYNKGLKNKGMKIDFIDVRRAYFQAMARRDIYVDLPSEDSAPGMSGKLVKAMYGTRDAAAAWESTYSKTLMDMGFRRGRSPPCLFWHPTRHLRTLVHGDDFTVVGTEVDLKWLAEEMKSWFELKVRAILGPGDEDDKEVVIFNRIARWTPIGIEYEADPRHRRAIMEHFGLDKNSRVSGKGDKEEKEEE